MDTRSPDALAISTSNPYPLTFSDRCPGQLDSNQPRDAPPLLGVETSRLHLGDCQPDLSSDSSKFFYKSQIETEDPFSSDLFALAYTQPQPEKTDFNLNTFIKELDADRSYVGSENCIDLPSDEHGPRLNENDCGISQSHTDYTELIGVFTLALVAALLFALVPLVWLLHPHYRAWRLRRYAAARGWEPPIRAPGKVAGERTSRRIASGISSTDRSGRAMRRRSGRHRARSFTGHRH